MDTLQIQEQVVSFVFPFTKSVASWRLSEWKLQSIDFPDWSR
jgi:hypothetical protein